MMRAGPWTVEVVRIDGQGWYRVKRYGSLVGGEIGRRHGLVATPAEVKELLGDSFEDLTADPE